MAGGFGGVGRRLSGAALALVAGALVATAASGPAAGAAGPEELLPNGGFDSSLAGWTTFRANLTFAADGLGGTQAARIADRRSFSSFALDASSAPVAPTTPGMAYVAEAWLRSDTPGKSVCLRLTESGPGGAKAGTKQRCLVLSAEWQRTAPLRYTTATGGGRLDLRLLQRAAVAGDSFEADGISLIGPPADVSPPSAPGPLSPDAVSDTDVHLSWLPSSDDVGVTGYRVSRDGVGIAAVPGSQTSFADSALAPSTQYAYEVRALDGAGNVSDPSDELTVTTLAAPPADPVIAAAGDIACDPASASFNGGQGTATLCRQQATANLVEAMSPDAVLVLGDSQYDCGGASAYARSFDPSWGAFKSLIHPAVGNHEYTAAVTGGSGCDGTGQAAGYYGYFGAAAGDAGQGYYSFDLGQWHVIALNSNCTKVSCLAGSPQLTWLASDLAAHSVACTLAFWHHPRFSSGLHGDDARFDPFWTTLQAGGADVVLNGHDHDYERFAPQMLPGAAAANGITEFVVGTGGRSRYGFVSTPSSNTVIRSSGTFGVLKMTLSPSSFSWEFVPEPGSAFSDAGSAPCH